MANEGGVWIMRGPSWDDPKCIHTVDGAVELIEKIGFLPLFKNGIDGFSLEEYTAPEFWWSGDAEKDPWEWREIIAREGKVAYGKFFDKKAGFISTEWLSHFANCRRDGYDFDALWDDGKAQARAKKIMDLYVEDLSDSEYYSFELEKKAGFGKHGEKGFDGVLTALQMQIYLCVSDFRQRRNKIGEPYGWPIAVYATPEHLWGYESVTSAYSVSPSESAAKIAEHMRGLFPDADGRKIRKICGV